NLEIPLAPLRRAQRKESVDTEWARIGVVTKKLCAKRATDFQKVLAPPPIRRDRWRWNRHRVPYFPTDINPGATLSWPENRVFRRRFVRSYPNFQLEILLVPGARQKCKRDLRGVEAIEVRGIHHRASQSFRTTKGDSAEFSAEV
ncbi:hypothetical protein Prudu_021716, partial [Prunus dulcis]